MSNRYPDWFRQAQADLQHARHSFDFCDFDWCCFTCHQASEKGLKALFLKFGQDAWGHTLTTLIGNLPESASRPSSTLIDYARSLGKFYIPTRDPNSFDSGAPTDYYTEAKAQAAFGQAEAILAFCSDQSG